MHLCVILVFQYVIVKSTFARVFTIKMPKGEGATRTLGVLVVKIQTNVF